MMREPATEAVYNIDDRLARRVIDGVCSDSSGSGAELVVGDNEVLAREAHKPGGESLSIRHRRLRRSSRYRIRLVAESRPAGWQLAAATRHLPTGARIPGARRHVALGILKAEPARCCAADGLSLFPDARPLVRMVHALGSFDPNAPGIDTPGRARARHERRAGSVGALGQPLAGGDPGQPRAPHRGRDPRLLAQHRAIRHLQTDLANRKLLLANTAHAMAGATAEFQLAIVIADVREFRDINAQYGVDYGDDALREVAHRLSFHRRRQHALTARLAEDAFAFPGVGA